MCLYVSVGAVSASFDICSEVIFIMAKKSSTGVPCPIIGQPSHKYQIKTLTVATSKKFYIFGECNLSTQIYEGWGM
jgi:hypothetical protein